MQVRAAWTTLGRSPPRAFRSVAILFTLTLSRTMVRLPLIVGTALRGCPVPAGGQHAMPLQRLCSLGSYIFADVHLSTSTGHFLGGLEKLGSGFFIHVLFPAVLADPRGHAFDHKG